MPIPRLTADQARVAQAFSAAAQSYDEESTLQQNIGSRLLAYMRQTPVPEQPSLSSRTVINASPMRVLDLGCGTGFFISALQHCYPTACIMGMDFARGMIEQARSNHRHAPHTWISGDCHALPLHERSVEIIYANVVFQWCENLKQVLAECRRVLTARGQLFFSMMIEPSLHELRTSWQHVRPDDVLMSFYAADDVLDQVTAVGFNVRHTERYSVVLDYPSLPALLTALKAQGTHRGYHARTTGVLTADTLLQITKHYRILCAHSLLFPLTYEVILVHAT